jgi:hypothetical protein
MRKRSSVPLPRVAVLDDYQEAALSSADWSAVTSRADVTVSLSTSRTAMISQADWPPST